MLGNAPFAPLLASLPRTAQSCPGVHADSGAQPQTTAIRMFTKLPLHTPARKRSRRPRAGEGFPQLAPHTSASPGTWLEVSLSLDAGRAAGAQHRLQGTLASSVCTGQRDQGSRGTRTYRRFAAHCYPTSAPSPTAETFVKFAPSHLSPFSVVQKTAYLLLFFLG